MIRLSTIHHVAIIVSEYQKSRDFYVNKLGFEIIRENYREQRGDYKLVSRQLVEHLCSARDNLLFKPYQNGSKTPENQGFPGFYYI